MKRHTSRLRSDERDFDQNPALHAECDTSIGCIAGAYPREGCRSVTPLLMPWSTAPKTSALFYARKWIPRTEDDKNRPLLKFCMHTSHIVLVSETYWSGLLLYLVTRPEYSPAVSSNTSCYRHDVITCRHEMLLRKTAKMLSYKVHKYLSAQPPPASFPLSLPLWVLSSLFVDVSGRYIMHLCELQQPEKRHIIATRCMHFILTF